MLKDILQSQSSDSLSVPARQQLLAFYADRQFRPVWTGGLAEQDRAKEAIAVLSRAEDQGLRSEDYLSPKLEGNDRPRRGREGAEFDIALTNAVLHYARDVSIGRVSPNDVYKDVQLRAPNFDAANVLEQMLRRGSISAAFADLPPPHPEYRRLAEAMARYRAIAAQGGWPSLPTRGEIGLAGSDRRLKALTERLASEDPALASIANPSSEEIQAAVKRFQARNGLEADGRVASATLAALNVPLSTRMESLAANMERWRWLPRTFEDRYVAINVPDQSVTFVRNGDVALTSRVVVGRKTSRTPILRAEAIAIIVNPPWEIPGDIVVNQLLPKLRRNSGYLQASNMVLMNEPNDPFGKKVNWRSVSPSTFPYKVVQIPGPHNALGNMMLDTPNDFDVYLHDTPGKQLFKSADRAVSNGCIRVEAIFQLASLALAESDAESRLTELIGARDTKRVELRRPLPVYFLYWTAIAAPDGGVGFRGDLYGRDAPLIEALGEPPSEGRELVSRSEANTIRPSRESARVSDTLLPADIEPGAGTEAGFELTPLDERGAELPPLDEPATENPPLSAIESATQTDKVADAVRRANERTQFPDTIRRSEAERIAPAGLRRTWPDETTRYGGTRRADGRFPLIKWLMEGRRPPQNRYPRRPVP